MYRVVLVDQGWFNRACLVRMEFISRLFADESISRFAFNWYCKVEGLFFKAQTQIRALLPNRFFAGSCRRSYFFEAERVVASGRLTGFAVCFLLVY